MPKAVFPALAATVSIVRSGFDNRLFAYSSRIPLRYSAIDTPVAR
jgi:hypothetical protein